MTNPRKKAIAGLWDAAYIRQLTDELRPKLESRGETARVNVLTLAKLTVLLTILANELEE